jgi:hypothetical protein
MVKHYRTLYRTYDLFDIENEKQRYDCLTLCIYDALKSGLSCKHVMNGTKTKLYMTGTKRQFIKYYLNTMFYNESFTNAVRRLVNCISWK